MYCLEASVINKSVLSAHCCSLYPTLFTDNCQIAFSGYLIWLLMNPCFTRTLDTTTLTPWRGQFPVVHVNLILKLMGLFMDIFKQTTTVRYFFKYNIYVNKNKNWRIYCDKNSVLIFSLNKKSYPLLAYNKMPDLFFLNVWGQHHELKLQWRLQKQIEAGLFILMIMEQ